MTPNLTAYIALPLAMLRLEPLTNSELFNLAANKPSENPDVSFISILCQVLRESAAEALPITDPARSVALRVLSVLRRILALLAPAESFIQTMSVFALGAVAIYRKSLIPIAVSLMFPAIPVPARDASS